MARSRALEGDVQPYHLRPLAFDEVQVDIVGTRPLLMHRWATKALREIGQKQAGEVRRKKEPKTPEAEYRACFYRLPDGRPGMPAAAFKAAIVSGCRFYEGLEMTKVKLLVHVFGQGPEQLVPIIGKVRLHTAVARNQNKVADLRYRPMWWPWGARLRIRYNQDLLTRETLGYLIMAGGEAGVGDWRPSSPLSVTGSYGTFKPGDRGELDEMVKFLQSPEAQEEGTEVYYQI